MNRKDRLWLVLIGLPGVMDAVAPGSGLYGYLLVKTIEEIHDTRLQRIFSTHH